MGVKTLAAAAQGFGVEPGPLSLGLSAPVPVGPRGLGSGRRACRGGRNSPRAGLEVRCWQVRAGVCERVPVAGCSAEKVTMFSRGVPFSGLPFSPG